MSLADKIVRAWPPDRWRDRHVLVAVSGGADSVALLLTLGQIKQQAAGAGQLVVAHFNHRLRAEADQDEAWVGMLAKQLALDTVVGHADSPGQLASEQAARDARYTFLTSAAERLGARYVATAHTADDQVETILMRVVRGSGIDGLAGIPPARSLSKSVTLMRPMLDVRRSEIESALATLGQDFRTDLSNFDSQFTRNWIRSELLPSIRSSLGGDPDGAILRLAQQATEWRNAIDRVAEQLASRAIEIDASNSPVHMTVDCMELADQPPIVIQQACRLAWRQACWPEQSMGMVDWQTPGRLPCWDAQCGGIHVCLAACTCDAKAPSYC